MVGSVGVEPTYEEVGYLEFQLLRMLGLKREHDLIDVGCGNGHLAVQLAAWLRGKYTGTDILPPLLESARRICGRLDWTFQETNGLVIPAKDESADMVTFFSVLTHITHEESYHDLEEDRTSSEGGRASLTFPAQQ